MRQFNSQQRWIDFLDAFVKVTRKVEELQADAYVMAGDIFHKYRPHPGIIRRFLKEISSLDCPTIMIRGNHDSPMVLFEKYGGDTLHLIRDVSDLIYLNRKNPTYEMGDICFVGLGYVGFNTRQEIDRHVQALKTRAKTKVGVFHQLLDYPGVPENRAEISRGFLTSLGLDYVLMGHYHVAYSEERLFNSGSPEYWAFDQAEQVRVDLDTGEETVKPAKKRGFYFIETENGKGEFVEVEPARPMFCITYETISFNESVHTPKIKEHLEKYNVEGALIKTIIRGRHKFGQMNLNIVLSKPLIHTATTRLVPSSALPEKVDIIKTQADYLAERGIEKAEARKIAEWLEHNKERLAEMQSRDILNALRDMLHKEYMHAS
jgi:DNA repair exonuclease SbcCD nuclease subunit